MVLNIADLVKLVIAIGSEVGGINWFINFCRALACELVGRNELGLYVELEELNLACISKYVEIGVVDVVFICEVLIWKCHEYKLEICKALNESWMNECKFGNFVNSIEWRLNEWM